jgi:hypothetical protein
LLLPFRILRYLSAERLRSCTFYRLKRVFQIIESYL